MRHDPNTDNLEGVKHRMWLWQFNGHIDAEEIEFMRWAINDTLHRSITGEPIHHWDKENEFNISQLLKLSQLLARLVHLQKELNESIAANRQAKGSGNDQAARA